MKRIVSWTHEQPCTRGSGFDLIAHAPTEQEAIGRRFGKRFCEKKAENAFFVRHAGIAEANEAVGLGFGSARFRRFREQVHTQVRTVFPLGGIDKPPNGGFARAETGFKTTLGDKISLAGSGSGDARISYKVGETNQTETKSGGGGTHGEHRRRSNCEADSLRART